MRKVRFLNFHVRVPRNMLLRICLGVLLIIGGFLSFLPVLGVWMLPLGLIVLSIDFPGVRRLRRAATVRFGLFVVSRWPGIAQRIGFKGLRATRW